MARKSAPKRTPAYVPCTIRTLPEHEQESAAAAAVRANPANAPLKAFALALPDPMQLAYLTQRMWGPQVRAAVKFLDTPDAETRRMILSPEIGANAWAKVCNALFVETNSTDADVRILRADGGYASYLGTDNRFIPKDQPTMWLQGFTARTIADEYRRVVPHEFGHYLGFPHEHQLPEIVEDLDEAKTIAWGRAYQHWSEAMVRAQMLTPLDPNSYRLLRGADRNGIMCYSLPGTITKSGKTIPGGKFIDAIDAEVAQIAYPGYGIEPPKPPKYPGDVYVDDQRGILWWWNDTGRPLVQPFPGIKVRIEADASRSLVVAACGQGGPPRAVGYDWKTGAKVFDLNPVPHFPANHRGGVFPSIRPEGGQVSFSGYGRWVVEVNPDGGKEIGGEERNPDAPAGSVLRRLIV